MPDNEIIDAGVEMAKHLTAIVNQQKLAVDIHGKPYLRYEAWAILAAMHGHRLVGETVQPLGGDDDRRVGYRATATVHDAKGNIVSRATCTCDRSERQWANADNYAVESMAQTRAAAKAARLAYSWVAVLAGFEPTPYEEMAGVGIQAVAGRDRQPDRPAPPPRKPTASPPAATGTDLTVTEVGTKTGISKKTGSEWVKYIIHLSDGREVSTFKQADADIASAAQNSGAAVRVATTQTQWGFDLTAIEILGVPDSTQADPFAPAPPDDAPPPTDDEVPADAWMDNAAPPDRPKNVPADAKCVAGQSIVAVGYGQTGETKWWQMTLSNGLQIGHTDTHAATMAETFKKLRNRMVIWYTDTGKGLKLAHMDVIPKEN